MNGSHMHYDPEFTAIEATAVAMVVIPILIAAVGTLLWNLSLLAAGLGGTLVAIIVAGQMLSMFYTSNPEKIHPNTRDEAPVDFEEVNDE